MSVIKHGEYDIDLIAKRDAKQKLQKTVIKRWNVVMSSEESEEEKKEEADAAPMSEEEAEKSRMAQEIIDRLNAEAAEDEAIKQAEIEAARARSEETYNVTTGSHSGTYGKGDVSENEREMIDSIMSEKGEALQHLIEETAAGQ